MKKTLAAFLILLLTVASFMAGRASVAWSGSPVHPPAQIEQTAPARSASSTPQSPSRKVTYVLNTSSKKIHRPSCRFVDKISDANREDYTGTYDDLIDMGYEPCKTCDPW